MYWLILIITLWGILRYDLRNNARGKEWLYFSLTVLAIFTSTFAYLLGTDAPYYQAVFENDVPTLFELDARTLDNLDSSFNIGFTLLMSLCKTISPSFYFFKFIFACIVNITIFSFFKNNANMLFMALLFYFMQNALYFNFEILREALAVCVFIWSLSYLGRKQWVKYLLFCVLAITFHISAIIMFFVPFIQRIKVGELKPTIIMGAIIILLIILGSQFMPVIRPIVQIFDMALDMNHGEHYLDSDKYGYHDSFSLSIPVFLFDVVLPIVMLYIIPRKKGAKPYYPYVFFLPVLVVLSTWVGIFFRFANYFMVFRILFYIEIFDYFSELFFKQSRPIAFITVCLLYLVLIFNLNELSINDYGNRSIDRYYPYSSILQDSSNPDRLYHQQRTTRY